MDEMNTDNSQQMVNAENTNKMESAENAESAQQAANGTQRDNPAGEADGTEQEGVPEGQASEEGAVARPPTLQDAGFRPLTRIERRNLWLKEYGEQDFALQMWTRLVEEQDLEIEMMFQMHGLLVFGVMVSTAHYAQFYIDLNEELHRQRDPDTADALREYYTALVPAMEQSQIGPEGLPIVFRYIHMRDVTIMSAGHKIKLPYWRGKIAEIDGFVVGATAGE